MSSKAIFFPVLCVLVAIPTSAHAGSFDGFNGQGRFGLQFGVVPKHSSIMPGIFLGGGVRYGAVRVGADVNLAIGGSRSGNGFAMMANALGTVGMRGPAGPFSPYADLHLGPGFVHAEGGGTVDRSGWMAGAALGVVGLGRTQPLGGFVQIAGYMTLDRAPVFPIFVRFGVAAL